MHLNETILETVNPAVLNTAPVLKFAPAVLASMAVVSLAPSAQSLPVADTRSGNVFTDRVNPAVAWYLPAFTLAADVDPAFAFAAAQAGVTSTGAPYELATLSVGIAKTMPADALAYQAQNPAIALREIPLRALAVTLTTSANDEQTGQPVTSTYPGTIATAADGTLSVSFPSLLGVGVIIAYQNLQTGGATIALSASFDVLRTDRRGRPIFKINQIPIGERPPFRASSLDRFNESDVTADDEAAFNVRYGQAVLPFDIALALGTKYAGVGYATKFTVTSGTTTHAIAGVDDLSNFHSRQSEFSEFTALGDISQKYPSFSRLYIGAISRTIVAVPAAYGIVRGSTGTAAVCQALLDSTAGSTAGCKFDFTFVLGPVYSPIELLQLSQEIAASPQANTCSVVLPTRIDPRSPSTLATSFTTSSTYLAGSTPHTFSLTVSIADGGPAGLPAVANANLFIKQLTAAIEPYLVGQLAVQLDDFYEQPVLAAVVLNFTRTSGADELGFATDPVSGAIALSNSSPLDLSLTRYAAIANGQVTITPLASTLAAKATTSLPAVKPGPVTDVLIDRTLVLESPFTKAATSRYLAFAVQDVQNVQYQLAVVASGVDFGGRGIAAIGVTIVLTDVPALSVPAMTLTALDQSVNTQIQLPIQYAIGALNATIALMVTPQNPQQTPVQFSLTNDFIDRPVFILGDAAIPALAPTA